VGIECRNTGGNHTLVFVFTNNVVSGSAMVTAGTGSVTGTPVFSGNTMTVQLTGVTNAQTITVNLTNIMDEFGEVLPGTAVNMGMLVGDSNSNRSVNASDVSQTKGRIGQTVSPANFRSDANAGGSINATDTSIVKSNIGTGLP
jgi:hypothetical protein